MKALNIKESIQNVRSKLLDTSIREKVFILLESLITFLTAFAAMIINFVQSEITLGYIALTFSGLVFLFLIIEFVLFSKYNRIANRPFIYANFFLTYTLVILYLIFAPKSGIYLYWIVSFPLVLCVVGGTKRGTFYCVVLLVIIVLFFYVPPFKDWMIGKYTGDNLEVEEKDFNTFKIFFILNYLMTIVIGIVVALINDTIIKRLNVLKDEYYRDANTDITTGLKNQMFFLSYVRKLRDEVEPGDTIGLMFIDIDDFKVFNDKYGHMTGNDVLIMVANKLNEIPHSLLVRWGGDEFAIIERNITKDEFLAKANYLLKSVEGLGKGVTISIGLAFYVVDDGFDFDKIFNDADMKTISAKNKGKNCIVFNE